MSQTPIFDELYTEFLDAKRVVPVRATMDRSYEHPIPELHETQEIPVVTEAAPNVIAGLQALHHQPAEVVLDETDEEWQQAVSEPAVAFEDRIRREIMLGASKPSTVEMPVAAEALKHVGEVSPFVAMVQNHQHSILYPDQMPTREMLNLEAAPAEEPETAPDAAPVVDEVQHVFPLTRGRHHRFTGMPVVTKLSDALKSVVFEETAA